MSVQVLEQLGSRDVSKSGGKLTARRSFHVWDEAAPLATPGTVVVLFGTGGLPVYGETFPESPNLQARDYRLSRVDGHRDLWLVEWEYVEADLISSTVPEVQPGEVGYVEITARITAGFVDAWRALTTVELADLTKAGGKYPFGNNNASRLDIGGTPIDVAGEPTQQIVRQIELQVTEVQSGIPNLTAYLPFTWARNNVAFMGAPIGQLLYVGANVSRIDVAKFQWQHTFVLDRWWHMRQQPYKWPDGKVPTMGPVGSKVAESVFFVQPFPSYANFFAMSSNFTRVQSAPIINVPFLGFP